MNANQETELFRKRFGDDFPHLIDLVSKSPVIFVNSNEMYDFARPTLHKIVYIGGIGLNFTIKKETPLPEEFVRILAKTDNVVVMSFGSVANVTLMPASWKKAFMDAFASRPDIQFILRYDANDLDNLRPPNVHFFPWLTQNELLRMFQHSTLRFIDT
ncbi:hypothetical protein AB6A40_010984 [Gnathostoma spinigerum]|uniref:glucuronosyltransferase n=1 Tax=Gnathostoma spinigerum TaxID=75299 RepID=A0ABD6EWG1_9BILA